MTATTQPQQTTSAPLTLEAFLDEVDRHNREIAASFGCRHLSWRALAARRTSRQAQDAWEQADSQQGAA